MAWKDLNLQPRIVDALNADFATPERSLADILTAFTGDLINQTGLSAKDIDEVKNEVAKVIVPQPPARVLELYRDSSKPLDEKLSVGSPQLDRFLGGGILIRRITEISGESASGKTQLCLQLSLTAQLPKEIGGLDAAVAYVCTEDAFPSKRFYELAKIFSTKFPEVKKQFTDNVFIQHVPYVEKLKKCLAEEIPVLINRSKVGLLIIDSIAALFRGEYAENFFQRSQHLRAIGSHLHRLCTDYEITIVCVNQISDVPGGKSVPSLGVTWSNLINARFFLSRVTSTSCDESTDPSASIVKRTLEVVFAPNLPKASCHFIVSKEGIAWCKT